MSKILSGKYKGRKIQSITSPIVRPTLAKVKKSIFQILEPINGSRVLDLYSGFGSIAIEFISRGAVEVVMVEKSRNVIKILNSNLNSICLDGNFKIAHNDVNHYLKKESLGFNIIYADPPYDTITFNQLREKIKPHLKNEGIFCMEMRKNNIIDNNVEKRNYGNTQIAIWRKSN